MMNARKEPGSDLLVGFNDDEEPDVVAGSQPRPTWLIGAALFVAGVIVLIPFLSGDRSPSPDSGSTTSSLVPEGQPASPDPTTPPIRAADVAPLQAESVQFATESHSYEFRTSAGSISFDVLSPTSSRWQPELMAPDASDADGNPRIDVLHRAAVAGSRVMTVLAGKVWASSDGIEWSEVALETDAIPEGLYQDGDRVWVIARNQDYTDVDAFVTTDGSSWEELEIRDHPARLSGAASESPIHTFGPVTVGSTTIMMGDRHAKVDLTAFGLDEDCWLDDESMRDIPAGPLPTNPLPVTLPYLCDANEPGEPESVSLELVSSVEAMTVDGTDGPMSIRFEQTDSGQFVQLDGVSPDSFDRLSVWTYDVDLIYWISENGSAFEPFYPPWDRLRDREGARPFEFEGRFFAFGGRGADFRGWHSDDGSAWDTITGVYLEDIAVLEGEMVATAGGEIYRSSDGLDWSPTGARFADEWIDLVGGRRVAVVRTEAGDILLTEDWRSFQRLPIQDIFESSCINAQDGIRPGRQPVSYSTTIAGDYLFIHTNGCFMVGRFAL